MQGKKQKPKVRLMRNDDGSLGVPRDTARQADDLVQAWDQQKSSMQAPVRSVTEELKEAKSSLKQRVVKRKEAKKQKANGNTTAKTLTLQLPTAEAITKRIPRTKKGLAVSGVVLVVGFVGIYGLLGGFSNAPNDGSGAEAGQVQGAVLEKVVPDFPVITPLGKGVDDLGGFVKISPEGTPAVFAFKDTIGSTPIKVSQQQLPDNLRTDQAAKLKELATGFNAKEPLEVGDNTAYIGTSVNGAQSIVYIKGENLVLIASDSSIPNSEWVTYIGNLRY